MTAEPEGDSSAGVPEELVNFAIMLADAASEARSNPPPTNERASFL